MCVSCVSYAPSGGPQAFILVYGAIFFALTYRWKVGVRAAVSAAVSGEDRAATILPAFK